MRFLCLHGAGTNSQVLETQTGTILHVDLFDPHNSHFDFLSAALRYELENNNIYEYVEGVHSADIDPEIKSYYPDSDEYFVYFESSAASIQTALGQLATYVALEGPFDGVLAYSQGATLAAMYLIQHAQKHPFAPLPFTCAVFISGGIPADPVALEKGGISFLHHEKDGQLLKLPTAHIWGRDDNVLPGTSHVLSGLCEKASSFIFVHDEGHDVPSARSKEAVLGAVRAIRRAMDMALNAQ